jgi:hypothetical protein
LGGGREGGGGVNVLLVTRNFPHRNAGVDENPGEYILLPKNSFYKTLSVDTEVAKAAETLWWNEVYEVLHPLLHEAAVAAELSATALAKYHIAVTEEEHHVGVLQNPRRNEQVLLSPLPYLPSLPSSPPSPPSPPPLLPLPPSPPLPLTFSPLPPLPPLPPLRCSSSVAR